ncbi:MAG TPA: hypothetical protein VHS78_03265 [Candidatus Elarobacter sp.]|jgi:hypothetical protein|nr:hypothetical protein [Candidatus Elarobacter sp.]
MIRPVLIALVLSVALAACGHGGGARSVLPGVPSTTSGGSPGTKSTNVALFNGELWYGAGGQLLGVPLLSGGASAELDGSYDGIVDPVPVAMTVAPDGTLYDLISDGETSWALQAYAPGTFGATRPEETIRGNGYPQQIVLVGDGIDVLSTVNFNTANASSTLWTYAYGGGDNPRPIRTLSLGTNVTDVASDNADHLFVARRGGGGISVYGAAATCSCNPVRTIATGTKPNDAIAVSRDGIAYVLSKDPGTGAVTIDAYAPANGGPAPTRSIGPIAASRGTPMGGITVDSDGKVYVNFKDARNRNSADVYAPAANGAVAPLQRIEMPTYGGYVTAIAIGPLVPASAAPAPNGTLYVGDSTVVNAFPLSANGFAAPQRSLTALLGPDYPGGPTYMATASMATTTDGRLFVVRRGGVTPTAGTCSIAAEDPNANGSAGWLYDFSCDPRNGAVVARGAGPSLDIATFASGVTLTYEFSSLGTVRSGAQYSALATDAAGTMYFVLGPQVDEFPANSVSLAAPIRSIGVGGHYAISWLAAGTDGTVYAGALTSDDGIRRLDTVFATGPGQTSPSRSIGPFDESTDAIGALAVDSAGELYVGLYDRTTGSSKVNVYGPNANGQATPVRTILNAVPSAYGRGINAMTIFQ